MNISAVLMIVNVCLLWWLFMASSNTAAKVLLFLLALMNTWVALERFHVIPTRLGNRTILRSGLSGEALAPMMALARK